MTEERRERGKNRTWRWKKRRKGVEKKDGDGGRREGSLIHGLRAVLGCVPECVCVRVCVCALPMNSTISLNPLRHLPLSPSFTLELFRLPFFIFHPGERKKGKKKGAKASCDEQIREGGERWRWWWRYEEKGKEKVGG